MRPARKPAATFMSSIVTHSPAQRWPRRWSPPPCGTKPKGLPSQPRNRSGRNSSGASHVRGSRPVPYRSSGGEGVVLLRGERWAAVAPVPLRPGDAVRVLARRGLRLEVAPEGPDEPGGTP
jgi:hypothetical protein